MCVVVTDTPNELISIGDFIKRLYKFIEIPEVIEKFLLLGLQYLPEDRVDIHYIDTAVDVLYM
jgi:hypothetical protein